MGYHHLYSQSARKIVDIARKSTYNQDMENRRGDCMPDTIDAPNEETLLAIAEVQRMKNTSDKKLYANFAELLEDIEAEEWVCVFAS